MKKLPKVYSDLMNIAGISGYEHNVCTYMQVYMQNYQNFTIEKDKLGGVFAIKKSKNPQAKTLMVAGHLDEIGFIVAEIKDNGLLKIIPIGGINPVVFTAQVMNVYLNNQKIIKGIIGVIPPHLQKNPSGLDINNMLLDIGASSRQDAITHGVEVGNMVLYDNVFAYTFDNKKVISKAIDNRFGCALALEAIKKFNDVDLDYHLIIGATVQEEVGLRGVEIAIKMYNPDFFVALDASPLNDTFESNALNKLEQGFLIRYYDPRNIMHKGLHEYFKKLAQSKKIKYQEYKAMGGTDAAKALTVNEGRLSTTIGLPARYIHSNAAMFAIADIDAARSMLYALLNDLSSTKIAELEIAY